MNPKVIRYQDRKDHALRVLCAGTHGEARTNLMVALLKDPEELWRKFSNNQQMYRRIKQRG